MEDKVVTISRAKDSLTFAAKTYHSVTSIEFILGQK